MKALFLASIGLLVSQNEGEGVNIFDICKSIPAETSIVFHGYLIERYPPGGCRITRNEKAKPPAGQTAPDERGR